jgi:hypothetical protein
MNRYLTEAIHPQTGETYKIGDTVLVYQGRFGHNNIMTIGTMISQDSVCNGKPCTDISISKKVIAPEDINDSDKTKASFTYLSAVKKKLTDKEVKEIKKNQQIAQQYSNQYSPKYQFL